ncbi:MAG: TatD family deoxyribonuclease [Betaproteobacteria bacterium]|nr:TatD family deoxyribonuclease [Betaproteobacteria bacterium]
MLVDSHCHLDAAEFGDTASQIAQEAADHDVRWIVVPAVEAANFASVADLAAKLPNCVYALGIHPLYVPQAEMDDLNQLRAAVERAMDDERFVGIGEIGLDFFVPELSTDVMREKQTHFYGEQIKIARDFNLPVILHVRRSQDTLLKHLRRIPVVGGIAHAFNGSKQQAQAFIALGFVLGFGGAMTFTRALQIRRLATELPLEALVLETDAPDISPAWLHPGINTPAQLPQIAAVLAELRGQPMADIAAQTSKNVARVLPRLGNLMMR